MTKMILAISNHGSISSKLWSPCVQYIYLYRSDQRKKNKSLTWMKKVQQRGKQLCKTYEVTFFREIMFIMEIITLLANIRKTGTCIFAWSKSSSLSTMMTYHTGKVMMIIITFFWSCFHLLKICMHVCVIAKFNANAKPRFKDSTIKKIASFSA